MCIQLYLEVICKRPKKEGRSPNFYGFWSKEVHWKKGPQKKKILKVNHNYLVDPMEQGAVIFGG
jgi:hypothetical protein